MKRLVLLVLGLLALAAPTHAAGARLTAADRAAIDRTLDVFVPAAIARRHPERAFSVVTPHLRQDTKRAEWARGNLPVTPYPAVGTRFHAWTIDGLSRNYVMIDTQLHPRRGLRFGDRGPAPRLLLHPAPSTTQGGLPCAFDSSPRRCASAS